MVCEAASVLSSNNVLLKPSLAGKDGPIFQVSSREAYFSSHFPKWHGVRTTLGTGEQFSAIFLSLG